MDNFILKELLHTCKNSIKQTILLLLVSIVGILCMGTAIVLLIKTDNEVKEYQETYEEKQYYSILDNFVGENQKEISGEDGIVKLKKFHELLQNSEYFDYYMMYNQIVYVENYEGKDTNIYGYESNMDLSSRKKEIMSDSGEVKSYTELKGFWIGDNVIDDFNVKVSKGTGFTSDDFILTKDEPISVILGAEYADEYSVGDTMYVNFIFAEREARVAGILERGTNLYCNGKYVNLDRYVIMPIFLNDDYEGQEVYRLGAADFYTLRNSGTIATKLSKSDIQDIITEYSREAGFKTGYYVVEHDDTEKKTFGLGIINVRFLIMLIAIIVTSIIAILLAILYQDKINKNKRYYAVLMLNGSNKKQIYSIILCEFVILLLSAYVLGSLIVILTSSLGGKDIAYVLLYLFMVTIVLGIIPIISGTITFFKTDLIYYMKEEI